MFSCHKHSCSSMTDRILIEDVLILLIYPMETKKKYDSLTDKQVKAELRLTKEKWSSELYQKTSEEYKTLAAQVQTSVCILELVTGYTCDIAVRAIEVSVNFPAMI